MEFAAVTKHSWEHDQYVVTILGDHNSVTKSSASLHETCPLFFSCDVGMGMIQPECGAGGGCCGPQGPQASGREWMLGFFQRNSGMHALNKHVEQISFPVVLRIFRSWTAERLAASLSNPLLLKALSTNIGLQQPHSTTESTITVL